jgi:hypothetical protein
MKKRITPANGTRGIFAGKFSDGGLPPWIIPFKTWPRTARGWPAAGQAYDSFAKMMNL